MRDFLRFPIDAADQAGVLVSTIQINDAPGGPNVLPIAHTLRTRFKVGDPTNGAPHVRPLFPGRMVFIPDPAAPGIEPTAAQIDFAQFATWRTAGSLLVIHLFSKAERDLKTIAGSKLAVAPNMVWYSKIHLTKEFLQTTLAAHKEKIPGIEVATSSPDWIKHAVAGFLKGTFLPELRLGATAASDDAVTLPMPLLDMDAQGQVALDITMARGAPPRDAPDSVFQDLAGGLPSSDPRHPRVGRIPARLVLRELRDKIIDGQAGNAVPDAMLQPPSDLTYLIIRFTRIWKPEEEVSAYFPANSVDVGAINPVRQLFTGSLPPHGIIHVPVPAGQVPSKITVKITGPMRWVNGANPNGCWREMGSTPQFTFDMPGTPHIQMRRRMAEEMSIEPADTTNANACTYYSLRRTVRALVNNRIAGGRLNFDRARTSAVTSKLIDDAFTGNSVNAKASILAKNKPRTNVTGTDIRDAALTLIPILEMFFTGNAAPQVVNGSSSPVTTITRGRLFYDLWQSAASRFEDPALMRNYPNAHIGRGAPGAIVAFSLGTYHIDGERNPGEANADFFDRIVRAIKTGLSLGDVIQFWDLELAFNILKQRQWTTSTIDKSYGHSPVYHSTVTTVGSEVVKVYDQHGITDCAVQKNGAKLTLSWETTPPATGDPEEVWIAAKWIE